MSDIKIFNWPITIYYEDTDVGGVVYHANYLKFFERARTEMLRSIGVSQHVLLEQNLSFVVKSMNIDFRKGARLDEHLTVQTWVENVRKASLDFCQSLVNNDGQILCYATVKVACINPKIMKPQALPEHIKSEIMK
ncbi:TPA: tol-pal system-associated acyl-CoA thioesterase [Photobacterium damselae]